MRKKSSPFLTAMKTAVFIIQAAALFWTASLLLQSFRPHTAPAAEAAGLPPPALHNETAAAPTAPPIAEAPAAAESAPLPAPSPTADPGGPTALPGSFRLQSAAVCSPLKGIGFAYLDGIISDPYHPPPPGSDARHMGVDFAYYTSSSGEAIERNEINAVFPGLVAAVVFDRPPYGNMVLIETRPSHLPASVAGILGVTDERSLYHLYAHMENAPSVDPGYEIRCGQFLGRVGESGASGNPHLHLEMRMGPPGATFPVMAYDLTASPLIAVTEEEKQNYFSWRTSGTYVHFDPMSILRGGDELAYLP